MQRIRGTVIHVDPPYMGKKQTTVLRVVGGLFITLAAIPIIFRCGCWD